MRIPDAPVSLANVPAQTTGTQIGLTWSDGSNNGGTPVIDYRVSFNGGSGSVYTTIESNIVTLPYIAVSLTPGTTYSFIVQSRNAFGYSPFSASVEILAAQPPDRPTAPSTLGALHSPKVLQSPRIRFRSDRTTTQATVWT